MNNGADILGLSRMIIQVRRLLKGTWSRRSMSPECPLILKFLAILDELFQVAIICKLEIEVSQYEAC